MLGHKRLHATCDQALSGKEVRVVTSASRRPMPAQNSHLRVRGIEDSYLLAVIEEEV
jgi:hypothetical protein